jgi:hypothetical protein
MPRQDTRNPFPLVEGNPEATQNLIRNEHRLHRRHDPERQRSLRHAVERLAHSPGEVEECMRAIEQLVSQGQDIRPADVTSLLGVLRHGGNPMEALEEGEARREGRLRPEPSAAAEQSAYEHYSQPRERPERAPFIGREARVEEALDEARLSPPEEKMTRDKARHDIPYISAELTRLTLSAPA